MSVLSQTYRFASAALAVGILVLGTGTGAVAAAPPPVAAPTSYAAATGDLEGPQFYSGTTIDVSDNVDGDVYAAGQSVTISGDVTGDVIAAAQTITITGTVDGNVRLAAQDVTISGEVDRSGTVFAASVTVTDTGSFGTDIVGAANDVRIGGEVGRDAYLSVGHLRIDGTVGGNVTYFGEREAQIADGSVAGTVDFVQTRQSADVQVSPWVLFAGWVLGVLYALVALSVVTLFAGLLIPRWLNRVTDHLVPSPWKALLVGLVASIAVPFALLFLLVTIIGAPLALALGLVWIVLTLATFVFGAYYLGRLILRGGQHPVVKALLGGLILIVALQIPWLNVPVWLAMVFFGLGAQLLEFWTQRPWHAKSETDASATAHSDAVETPAPDTAPAPAPETVEPTP
ncbi:polymer-forming cytoskeletal protein [Microbacterium sp. CJ77]|uniref:polymer-forming cytoskeletal protein n=1 Tax=Microbacterium sp. CJ77 TaxID=2079201 RepID=UPI000CD8C6E7|nr:polymer-forming cytoskeletal protein [Microbacterium sp. CJ77]